MDAQTQSEANSPVATRRSKRVKTQRPIYADDENELPAKKQKQGSKPAPPLTRPKILHPTWTRNLPYSTKPSELPEPLPLSNEEFDPEELEALQAIVSDLPTATLSSRPKTKPYSGEVARILNACADCNRRGYNKAERLVICPICYPRVLSKDIPWEYCNIFNCPCEGKGMLFTEESLRESCGNIHKSQHLFQPDGIHWRSVSIWANKEREAVQRIKDSVESFNRRLELYNARLIGRALNA